METERLLIVDIETTGLSAREDVPLEIGMMLTRLDGTLIDQTSCLVYEVHHGFTGPMDRVARRETFGDDLVYNMHNQNGLWNELLSSDATMTRHQAETYLVGWLISHNIEPKTMPLVGSSVGSLDRPFILVHFPELNRFLSHRNIDVSSVKELCRRYNPDLFNSLEDEWEAEGHVSDNADHRVLSDCKASLEELLGYMRVGFLNTKSN